VYFKKQQLADIKFCCWRSNGASKEIRAKLAGMH